jgi:excisionase family DNA binding protein
VANDNPREVPEPLAWADLLTIPQAAVRLGVSRPTVYRMINAGQLPRIHVRAGARIPARAIDEILAAPAGQTR